MIYTSDGKGNTICERCNTIINISWHLDRHSCYWLNLEEDAIGMVVMTLDSKFKTYNALEKRIARAIWERVKIRAKPKELKKLTIVGNKTTNVEVYETWVKRGDQAVE